MPEIEFGPGGVRVDGVLMPKNAPLGWVRLTGAKNGLALLLAIDNISVIEDRDTQRTVFHRSGDAKSAAVTETLDEIAAAIAAAQGGR